MPQTPLILAVDIGNTSIASALFYGKKIIRRVRCLTHTFTASDLKPLASFRGKIDESIVCSVVPKANAPMDSALTKILDSKIVLLGRDRAVPIPNRTAKPRQVGMDRLVNAWASWRRFRRPVICVDFGTATTFDVTSGKGEYLGGVIAPGVQLTLNALAEKTALLPKIRLTPVSRVVGRDTVSSIRSGCAYGLGALCDGIIREINRQTGVSHAVIATGGYAPFMKQYTTSLNILDGDLTLKAIMSLQTHRKR